MIYNLFDNLIFRPRNFPVATDYNPLRVDLLETEQAYVLKADVPGIHRTNIHVLFENNIIIISAKVPEATDTEQEQERYFLCERISGEFSRKFRVPSHVTKANIDAKLAKGVLTVKITKPDPEVAREAKEIAIN